MKHKRRMGGIAVDIYSAPRVATAPWMLDVRGAPIELEIPFGMGAAYDEPLQMVHLREDNRGYARTVTPWVDVEVNHEEGYFEVRFKKPDDPRRLLPVVAIDKDELLIEERRAMDEFAFSNEAAFAKFCEYMGSPVYNPFATALPKTKGAYVANPNDGSIRMADGDPVDVVKNSWVGVAMQLDREIPVSELDGDGIKTLPPGDYDAEVAKCDLSTGDIELFRLTSRQDVDLENIFVEADVIAREAELGHYRYDETTLVERIPFDPSVYVPLQSSDLTNGHVAQPRYSGNGGIVTAS